MKAYPLIYSRTKYIDFVPDFLVRPKDLNCQLALKYVKSAMNNLDFLQDIRYTVFSVDNYCICGGIACVTTKLVEKLKLLFSDYENKYSDMSEYLRDSKGRALACFIGIAIPKSEVKEGMIPDISLEKYWEVYLKYLKKQWDNESSTISEQLEFPPIDDIEEKEYVELDMPQKEIFGSRSVIRNYTSHEQQILDYFFHSILNGSDESFITEIQNREEWETLNFKTAAVSESLFSSLKTNPTNIESTTSSLSGRGVSKADKEVLIKRSEAPSSGSRTTQKKTAATASTPSAASANSLKIIIAVVIIIIILLIMLRKV